MQSKKNNSLAFHKSGLQTLKLIHKVESSAIPIFILKSLTNSLYPFINIILSAYIIDSIIQKNITLCIYYIVGLITGNLIFGILLDLLNKNCEVKSIKVNQYVQIAIRKHALELDYETLENPKTLELINTADFAMAHRGGFGYLLINYGLILESLISIITSIALVIDLCIRIPTTTSTFLHVITSIPVSLTIIVVFLFINAYVNLSLAKYYNNKSIEIFQKQMKTERKFSYFLNQITLDFSKGKVIRLFNMAKMITNEERKHFDFVLEYNFKAMLKLMKRQAYTTSSISGFSILFAYIFVILKVLANAITIGALTKYIGAISQLNNAISQLLTYNDEVRVQCDFMKYYIEFMEIKNKRQTGTIPIEKRNDNVYEIEFHDVSFSYPGRDEKVLNRVSCKLTLKNKMAVVGRNGAGKTTFIKLLCRLYEPTEGYITLNGIDIRKYNYLEYLSLFGVVFQDFNLFAFPLDQNVASSVTLEEEMVWKCLELAGIKDRVEEMPENLKTPLYKYDEGGVEISGGEAQKIAIARALYKDAPFVILDEPTAALDPISEYEIYSRFNELVKDKTSIYISHRMSSCRFCDDIIVFNEGSIIQRGSHDELIEDKDNLYAHLWNAQAKYYVTNEN